MIPGYKVSVQGSQGPGGLTMWVEPSLESVLEKTEAALKYAVYGAGAAGVMLSTADGGPFEQLVSPLRDSAITCVLCQCGQ